MKHLVKLTDNELVKSLKGDSVCLTTSDDVIYIGKDRYLGYNEYDKLDSVSENIIYYTTTDGNPLAFSEESSGTVIQYGYKANEEHYYKRKYISIENDKIVFPCKINALDENCFKNITNLKTLDFSECPHLFSTDSTAFAGCINLESLRISENHVFTPVVEQVETLEGNYDSHSIYYLGQKCEIYRDNFKEPTVNKYEFDGSVLQVNDNQIAYKGTLSDNQITLLGGKSIVSNELVDGWHLVTFSGNVTEMGPVTGISNENYITDLIIPNSISISSIGKQCEDEWKLWNGSYNDELIYGTYNELLMDAALHTICQNNVVYTVNYDVVHGTENQWSAGYITVNDNKIYVTTTYCDYETWDSIDHDYV